MTTALILIDIQNDYFPGGKMELAGSPEAAAQAARLLGRFREHSLPLVHIQHVADHPGAPFFLPDTEGVNIQRSVAPRPGETVFTKRYPNSFRETPLLAFLRDRGVEEVVAAGMMTHMCVDATVRAAFDYGFRVTVVHDACATRDLSFAGRTVPASQVHLAFLAALSFIYARVAGADDFLKDF